MVEDVAVEAAVVEDVDAVAEAVVEDVAAEAVVEDVAAAVTKPQDQSTK